MRYSVDVESYGDVSVSKGKDGVDLRLTDIDSDEEHAFYLTFEEFKEFRRAVGYVWQEVEGK